MKKHPKAKDATTAKAGPLLFGTDGIRDRTGEGFLAPQEIERIVAATALVLAQGPKFPDDRVSPFAHSVVVARDTRESGEGLLETLAGSFQRHGYTVKDLGILPTPAAAYLASFWPDVVLGVVISASHNPAEYNGIKFVAASGGKVSDDFEWAVSEAYWKGSSPPALGKEGKRLSVAAEALEVYVSRLVSRCRRPERLRGLKVALDAANGATFQVAPEVFRRLGMEVAAVGDCPDGRNINQECGALHPDKLAQVVRQQEASIGFSFDGDGDRMIPIGRNGITFDGDHVLYLAAKCHAASSLLPKRTVVATVMSNFGLETALRKEGLELERTDVGDRNVYLAMVAGGHPLGGEQSGHTIFMEDARTGDGILSAVRLLDSLESDALDLENEASVIQRYPQVLKNVRVPQKLPFALFPEVMAAVKHAESVLAGRGRVVLRYSGTEPLARVMVEGDEPGTTEAMVDLICEAIQKEMVGEP